MGMVRRCGMGHLELLGDGPVVGHGDWGRETGDG